PQGVGAADLLAGMAQRDPRRGQAHQASHTGTVHAAGGVAERPIASVLKTDVGLKPTAGSNPAPSAFFLLASCRASPLDDRCPLPRAPPSCSRPPASVRRSAKGRAMLTLCDANPTLSRRGFLTIGTLGLAGLPLSLLAASEHRPGLLSGKSVVLLFQQGGPS